MVVIRLSTPRLWLDIDASFGWLFQLVGVLLVGWPVVVRSALWWVGRFVSRSVGWLVGRWAGQVFRLAGQFGWSVGWFIIWLTDQLVVQRDECIIGSIGRPAR